LIPSFLVQKVAYATFPKSFLQQYLLVFLTSGP